MDSNNLTPLRKGIVGVQFLFVAFGATVLVPLLVGLDPSTALFTAGIGTLIFHAVTRGKVPIFLGSSFAFIAFKEVQIISDRNQVGGIIYKINKNIFQQLRIFYTVSLNNIP